MSLELSLHLQPEVMSVRMLQQGTAAKLTWPPYLSCANMEDIDMASCSSCKDVEAALVPCSTWLMKLFFNTQTIEVPCLCPICRQLMVHIWQTEPHTFVQRSQKCWAGRYL